MTAFSEGERSREGPARAAEGIYSYLDSSSRPEAQEARETIERWLEDYPQDQLDRWLGDFRSADDEQHKSAFFELFLFQFFRSTGWNVTVEPELKDVRGAPDFLIEKDELRIVVEAISPNFRSNDERGREKLIADIKDAINAVRAPNHYLVLESIEAPAEAINKVRLVAALTEWLETNPANNEVFEYEDRGAHIKITVIHRPGREINSADYRAIGVEMGGVTVSTPGRAIKGGLERKASKYRSLNLPYIIALNARGFHDTEDDFLAATYGSSAVRISIGPNGAEGEPEMIRNTDGLYNDGGRARKRNVSAVLLFNGVAPWNWRDRHGCLIHNAYAERKIEGADFGCDCFLPEDGILTKSEGRCVGDLMGELRGHTN